MERCGGVKMGCIMTPMPNHLSTYFSLPLNHIRVVGMKGKERCGKWSVDEVGWSVDELSGLVC